ncbi:MAG: c-type cytochrome [Rhodospirillaceae bacterium]|nr:c-type cytochrome [Rhodospirillaceae bacterium]
MTACFTLRRLLAAAATLAALSPFLATPADADEVLARGEYLANIMDCTGCHTPGALVGKPDLGRFLGGSDIGFHIPEVGILYPPNLTPDTETGIGSWSVEDIMAAVRTGVRPDGRELVPLMPWPSYGFLIDEDALALATYLKSLPVVSHQVPAMVAGPDQAVAPYLTPVVPAP